MYFIGPYYINDSFLLCLLFIRIHIQEIRILNLTLLFITTLIVLTFKEPAIYSAVFSKSVLDTKPRLVVTVELEAKWMPDLDSASNFMPDCKFLGY